VIFSFDRRLVLLTGWLGEMFFGFPHLLSVGLYLGAYACGGLDIARHAVFTPCASVTSTRIY